MFAGSFEPGVPCGDNRLRAAREAVGGGNVVDGRVEAVVVVVLDEGGHDAMGLFDGRGRLHADGVGLERSVPAFDLSV